MLVRDKDWCTIFIHMCMVATNKKMFGSRIYRCHAHLINAAESLLPPYIPTPPCINAQNILTAVIVECNQEVFTFKNIMQPKHNSTYNIFIQDMIIVMVIMRKTLSLLGYGIMHTHTHTHTHTSS